MTTPDTLLHRERLARIRLHGKLLQHRLENLTEQVATATDLPKDPDITVLIRTRNNGHRLESLFQDIVDQEYDGRIEVVVVDTESTDKTVEIAKRHGARVISMKQETFDYPTSLNLGFEAAKYDYVLALVGHCNLTNRYALRAATRHTADPKFGGSYCFGLPDDNAKSVERFSNAAVLYHMLHKGYRLRKPKLGMLASGDCLVNKKVWRELGGYDLRYAAGGEDTALGRKMLQHGYTVYWEPLLVAFHSHGLGFINLVKQQREWIRLARPYPFDGERLANYGRDFSAKSAQNDES